MKKIVSVKSKLDNTELFGTLFVPEQKPQAFIAFFHGMSEHRHRYNGFAEDLVAEGNVVLLLDHRGHGDSALVRGFFAHEDGWLTNLKDLEYLIAQEREPFCDLPFILIGHSMGSLFARSYLKRNEKELDGIILMGTPNRPKETLLGQLLAKSIVKSKGEYYRSDLLEEAVTGQFNQMITDPKTKNDWLSLNPENVVQYNADEDCGFTFTASGYLDLMLLLDDVYLPSGWFVYNADLPILFLSGENDPVFGTLTDFESIIQYTYLLGYKNIRYQLYHQLRHEILNEDEADLVMRDIKEFINEIK